MALFNLFIFLGASLVSQIAATLVGFGASTLMLPVAILFIPIKSAIPIIAIYHFTGNLTKLWLFRKSLDRHTILTFGVPAILAAVVGALCIPFLPSFWIEKALAIFLLLFSTTSWHKLSRPKSESSSPLSMETDTGTMLGGAASGFLSGLLGTGGAVRSAVLTAGKLEKEKYLATSFAIALAVDSTRIPVYLNAGLLGSEYRGLILPLLVTALAGATWGKQIVQKLEARSFKKIILVALFLFGIKMIF